MSISGHQEPIMRAAQPKNLTNNTLRAMRMRHVGFMMPNNGTTRMVNAIPYHLKNLDSFTSHWLKSSGASGLLSDLNVHTANHTGA